VDPHIQHSAAEVSCQSAPEWWGDWDRVVVESHRKDERAIDCAFEFWDDNIMPPGHQKIDHHMVFDVEMTFKQKAQYIAGRHQTEPIKDIMFASMVSRESIRIAFLVAALNDLKLLSADSSGTYLNTAAAKRSTHLQERSSAWIRRVIQL
jgi:hypothetical protein